MIAAIHPADHPVEIHLPDARVIGHLQADSDSRGIVIFANGVLLGGHVHIGDKAVLGARSGVSNDVPPGVTVLGEPAIELRDRKLQLATISKLPEMRKDLKQLARQGAIESVVRNP